MNRYRFPEDLLDEIFIQAEAEYPRECCGLIAASQKENFETWRLIPCRNVQDAQHAADPQFFPRTAQSAYFLHPQDLLAAHKTMREQGEELCVIYHSHPDAEAVFSAEDKRMALHEGQPLYPGTAYLVVSVCAGKDSEARLYVWSPDLHDFQPLEIQI